jgi:hypothetical protein
MFETTKFLENLSIKNENNEKMKDTLDIISSYFQFMLNYFILEDLSILLIKYIKKNAEDFNKL